MSSTTSAEPIAKIEEVITKLDPDIQRLAKHWARNCPDDWEDLAQEARLGVYQKLKENPACPRHHLFHHAKSKILDYRKKGASVDGKLHQTHRRSHVWELVSLDANPAGVSAQNSSLYSKPHQPRHQPRPVEDQAVTWVAYGELRERLTDQQRQYLSMRLQGYECREADIALGLSRTQGERLRIKVQRQAEHVLLAIWKE